MHTADIHLWARALLNEDPVRAKRARETIARASTGDGLYLPLVVLVELSWVLRARWEWERVLDVLEALLHTHGVTVESAILVRKALESARKGRRNFPDRLVAEISAEAGASPVLTVEEAYGQMPWERFEKLR